MESFHKAGCTDEEYGLIYSDSDLDSSIGVEEYAVGETVKKALIDLGIEINQDVF